MNYHIKKELFLSSPYKETDTWFKQTERYPSTFQILSPHYRSPSPFLTFTPSFSYPFPSTILPLKPFLTPFVNLETLISELLDPRRRADHISLYFAHTIVDSYGACYFSSQGMVFSLKN